MRVCHAGMSCMHVMHAGSQILLGSNQNPGTRDPQHPGFGTAQGPGYWWMLAIQDHSNDPESRTWSSSYVQDAYSRAQDIENLELPNPGREW